MKEATRTTFVRGTGVIFILLALALACFGQKRPKSLDEGEVKETKRTTSVTRRPIKNTRPTKAGYSVLIVQAEPDNAEIKINGEPVGRAQAGEFRKELPSGQEYTVTVSAGPEYATVEKRVKLITGRPEIIEADLTSRYGRVMLGPAIEGAKILVNDQPLARNKYKIDTASGMVVIDTLPPGELTIAYDHPDYVIAERRFNISPGSEYTWTFIPKRATVEMTVRTEAQTAVYVDGEPRGETPNDGVLTLRDIRVGVHEVKLNKDGFDEYKQRYTFEFGKPVEVKAALVPRAVSTEFNDDFDINLSKWAVTGAGWKIRAGRLEVAGAPTIGFATGYNYRDFIMEFHLKLTNAAGAAWALRIKNSSNYYLFYLSGPDGLFPGKFVSYIVRDNKFDPQRPFNASPVLEPLSAGGQYTISISVLRDKIEHKITPLTTGVAVTLGVFEDPNKLFPIGSIGFRTVSSEAFSVDDLFVQPRQ